MTDKELIKQEIERRYNCEKCHPLDREANVAAAVLKELLLFIDSLPEEPASEDLEEAAEKYAYNEFPSIGIPNTVIELAFKAGAEWQKQQMMKDAVDGCVSLIVKSDTSSRNLFISTPQLYKELQKYKDGDKVKIIIVKEEQK